MKRWLGLKALIHDLIEDTAEMVKAGNASTGRNVVRAVSVVPGLEEPVRLAEGATRVGTEVTVQTIHVVNRVVERLTDLGLGAATERGLMPQTGPEAVVPLRSDIMGSAAWIADASLGAVNGILGDRLAERDNGLDLGMRLRVDDVLLEPGMAPPRGGPKVAIFVHGLTTTEWSWALFTEKWLGDAGATFGSKLEADLGHVSVFARYNSGRRVQDNGRLLAEAIRDLVARWPDPLEEIVLVGHSMGGLVVRSAVFHAGEAGHDWLDRVKVVVSLGTPHHGAPLARWSATASEVLSRVDVAGAQVVSRILEVRSVGIRDLQQGDVGDDLGRDPDPEAAPGKRAVPLRDDVRYAFLSATVTKDPEHPVGRFLGDMLVRVPSASGPTLEQGSFGFRTRTFGGVNHAELQVHPDVYDELLAICS